jgi:hypothetical protein
MLPDIRTKLVPELLEPITTERQVVYILCQLRKLVDRDPDKQRWKSLKLYCDWAMHPDLTFDNRTRPFLQEIDSFFFVMESPEGTGITPEQNAAIQKLVYLDGFRDELRAFLVEQKELEPELSLELTNDDEKWKAFLLHYGGVIRDGSLVYSGNDLQLIRRMTFTFLPPSSDTVPFNIKWEIEAKDGGRFSFMLHPNWKLVGSFLIRKHARTGLEPTAPLSESTT